MLNQWFKLAILAFVGIIVSSLAIGAVSGFDKQPDPAAGIYGAPANPNAAGHNTTAGGNHNPAAGANQGFGSNHGAPANGTYGQPGPNVNHGPSGQGYGPPAWAQYYMQQRPNGQMNMQGNMQGMGGGMMMMDNMMEKKKGMM